MESGKKTILVVDDKGISLRTAKAALDEYFTVRLASSGKIALSILEEQKIDLILLDMEMPEMSGFDILRQVKISFGDEAPPVIFVTASATPEQITHAKLAGAADYVLKPFEAGVLRKKVNDALAARG